MFKIQIDPESRDFRRASLLGLTGFALEILGLVADIPNQGVGISSPVALAATVTGTLLFVAGVYYLARSKNRGPGWSALGLLSLLGWILVAFLEDRAEQDGDASPRPVAGSQE